MGEVAIAADALWGANTQRAIDNLSLGTRPLPPALIHAYGLLKAACAKVNRDLKLVTPEIAGAIVDAADAVARGEHDREFPLDAFQTGSGTSTNMNLNEVIANLANVRLGGELGARAPVHPNDHVNLSQSSNDTFPSAMHIAAARQIECALVPSLDSVHEALYALSRRFDAVVKVGRTHLMDATPIRAGQVFSGYAQQAKLAMERARHAQQALLALPIGGTAVGTGLNTTTDFGARVCAELAAMTGLPFVESENHFEAQAARDAWLEASGQVKAIAVSLGKIANDIRWLGSGPRAGLGELSLPALQPGSSIMPGKVNPVICEAVIQVSARVIGNDAAITHAASGGIGSLFELNVAMPAMAEALLESLALLGNAARAMHDKLLTGLEIDAVRCQELVERSLMLVTKLAPVIGYDRAAAVAKEAMESGRSLRQVVLANGLIEPARLDQLLDPRGMTQPTSPTQGSKA
jgi:fumarate hydratase class II